MSSSHRRKGAPVFDVFQDAHGHDNDESDDLALIRSLQDFNQQIQHSEAGAVDTNLILNPPQSQHSLSPTKRQSPQSSPQVPVDSSFFDAVDFEAPAESFPTDSPSKKTSFSNYGPPLAPKPKKALFSTFPSSKSNNKENLASLDTGASDLDFNTSSSLGKRQLPEPTFIRDKAASKKRAVEDDAPGLLPEPEDMPVIIDEGGKPPYSYAQLIGMSILRAPGRKMTLSQIYKWINDTFEFYRNAGTGWQNSIRHNLSLNKAFLKSERPKDDPGKGHYWIIAEGFEMQFVRDKPQRRPVSSGQQAYGQPETVASDTYHLPPPMSASAFALPPQPARPTVVDSSKFPGDNELSSDATVDAGDQEEEPMPPPGRAQRTALTPEAEIQSSPPVAQLPNARSTPSLGGSRLTHSRSGGRKKHLDSFRDSGFYSSIESSAHRPQYVGPMQLTSEADHRSPVRKRGRAEDEIARISRLRSSSFDHSSPAKASKIARPAKRARTSHKDEPSLALNSSSPLRPAQLGFPPLTPGLKLDPRLSTALPTASPTTLLERHRNSIRDLVGTPARGLATLMESQKNISPFAFGDGVSPNKYSPLKSVETAGSLHEAENAIAVDPGLISPIGDTALPQWVNVDRDNMKADDGGHSWLDFVANGSPFLKKQSAPRPSAARAHTSTGILGDITNGSRGNMRLASPFRMSPGYNSAAINYSPTKSHKLSDSLKNDAFLGNWIESGSESEGEGGNPFGPGGNDGVDIFKGFRSIGSGADKENASGPAQQGGKATEKTKSARPALGRTMTNAF